MSLKKTHMRGYHFEAIDIHLPSGIFCSIVGVGYAHEPYESDFYMGDEDGSYAHEHDVRVYLYINGGWPVDIDGNVIDDEMISFSVRDLNHEDAKKVENVIERIILDKTLGFAPK